MYIYTCTYNTILIRKKLRQYCNFLIYDDARIIEDCSTSKLAIIGDFNANVGTIFESELISFVLIDS